MSSKNKQTQQQTQQQDPTQLYNQLLAERLFNTPFEIDAEQRKHIAYLQGFKHCLSYNDLGQSMEGYRRLVELPTDSEINLLDASYFLNGIDRMSPGVMGITVDEYYAALQRNDEVSQIWNKIVMPLKTAVMREVQAKLQRNIIIPPNNLNLHKN